MSSPFSIIFDVINKWYNDELVDLLDSLSDRENHNDSSLILRKARMSDDRNVPSTSSTSAPVQSGTPARNQVAPTGQQQRSDTNCCASLCSRSAEQEHQESSGPSVELVSQVITEQPLPVPENIGTNQQNQAVEDNERSSPNTSSLSLPDHQQSTTEEATGSAPSSDRDLVQSTHTSSAPEASSSSVGANDLDEDSLSIEDCGDGDSLGGPDEPTPKDPNRSIATGQRGALKRQQHVDISSAESREERNKKKEEEKGEASKDSDNQKESEEKDQEEETEPNPPLKGILKNTFRTANAFSYAAQGIGFLDPLNYIPASINTNLPCWENINNLTMKIRVESLEDHIQYGYSYGMSSSYDYDADGDCWLSSDDDWPKGLEDETEEFENEGNDGLIYNDEPIFWQ